MTTILVTGATGRVGTHVVSELAKRVKVRAAMRDPGDPKARWTEDVERVAFDFEKPESIDTALRGTDALFLLAPAIASMLELHALGRAGRAAKVSRAVAELTGRPATTFEAFASAHAAAWVAS
jgi:uncharacterized protein YbjT (DUF2867 family)